MIFLDTRLPSLENPYPLSRRWKTIVRHKVPATCHWQWLIEAVRARCDRLLPCSTCSSKGLDSLCAYAVAQAVLSGRPHGSAHVQDRINRLENLVISLMQQAAPSPHGLPPEPNYPAAYLPITPDQGPHEDVSTCASGNYLERPMATNTEQTQRPISPSPTDYGSIRNQESGASCISSAHWTAVLDSIA